MTETHHESVLLREVLEMLDTRQLKLTTPLIMDCTVGGGGHSRALLEQDTRAHLLAVDRDCSALERAAKTLSGVSARVSFLQARFDQVLGILPGLDSSNVIEAGDSFPLFDAVLVDLGLSSDQLDSPERGFSFRTSGPLDMRMDQSTGKTAAEILNSAEPRELKKIFRQGGVGRETELLVSQIINKRPIETTSQFADICRSVASRRKPSKHNPATVPFQALRIAVNSELEAIATLMEQLADILAPGGRLAVISFHSLEDQAVTRVLRKYSTEPAELRKLPPQPGKDNSGSVLGELLTKKAIVPSEQEQNSNPRSRSARLRVFQRSGAKL